MIYYFNQCPSCANEPLKMVRQIALELHSPLEERYVSALPRWGHEADALSKATNVTMPFLYDPASNLVCPVRLGKDDVKSFWEQCLNAEHQS